MAMVWAVWNAYRDERFALKVLTRSTPALRKRLRKEGLAQAALSHPNLLPVLEIVDIDSQLGLLMPLVCGPSLRSVLDQGRLLQDDALALMVEITEGLQAAHAAGLVHRDLKPSNVLLDVLDGRVRPRIADFGLVKGVHDDTMQTKTGAVMGTPAYAAPEQLRDASRVDLRADLFSLGVMLVELMTGQRPLPVGPHEQPPSLDGLPEPLRRLAVAMLSSDPTDRPGDAAAVLAVLRPLAPKSGARQDGPLGQRVVAAAAQHASLRADDTQVSVASEAVHNLSPRPRCIGRRDLTGRIHQALRDHAIVTLLGAGGVGKTTLALAASWDGLAGWDEVRFCALADARTPDEIGSVVCDALGVRPGRDPIQKAETVIRARGRLLLVLDNLEHLVEHAEGTIGRWQAAAPAARMLVTSRVPLRLSGEHGLSVDVLAPEPALEMLVTQIAGVRPGFRIDASNRDALVSITEQVDRLPLALALAAARCRSLTPEQLSARLSSRLLALRDRSLPARQQTLGSVLQWSWDLLAPAERDTLAQCSIFEGGFTLAAAEAVVDLGGEDVEDCIDELVEHNLLVVDGSGRFRMLNAVHRFAQKKASTPGLAQRHGAYFASLRRQSDELSYEAFLALIKREQDNIWAAHRRAITRADTDTAYAAGMMGCRRLIAFGPFLPGLEAMTALQGMALSPGQQARVCLRIGNLLYYGGKPEAAETAMLDACARFEAQEDTEGVGLARLWLGQLYNQMRRPDDARRELKTAEVLLAECSSMTRLAMTQQQLGALMTVMGEHGPAEAHLRKGLQTSREASATRVEGNCLENLGILYANRGQVERAREHYTAAQAIYERLGNRLGLLNLHYNLANLLQHIGEAGRAVEHFQASLALARADGRQTDTLATLVALSIVSQAEGDPDTAASYCLEALAGFEALESEFSVARARLLMARIRIRQGRAVEAREFLEACREFCIQNTRMKPLFMGTDALLWCLAGDATLAAARLSEIDATPVVDNWVWKQDVLFSCIETAHRLGEAARADSYRAELETLLAPLPELARAHTLGILSRSLSYS